MTVPDIAKIMYRAPRVYSQDIKSVWGELNDGSFMEAYLTGNYARVTGRRFGAPQYQVSVTPMVWAFTPTMQQNDEDQWLDRRLTTITSVGTSSLQFGERNELVKCRRVRTDELVLFEFPEHVPRPLFISSADIAFVSLLYGTGKHGHASDKYIAQALALGRQLSMEGGFPLHNHEAARVLMVSPAVYGQGDGSVRRVLRRFWSVLVVQNAEADVSWVEGGENVIDEVRPYTQSILRLNALALIMYKKILYLELDIAVNNHSFATYTKLRYEHGVGSDPIAGVDATGLFRRHLLALFDDANPTPACVISKSDFEKTDWSMYEGVKEGFDEPRADTQDHEFLVSEVGDWGMLINGGVLLLEPDMKKYELGRSILMGARPWRKAGRGGNDILLLAMVYRFRFFKLPTMFNAILPRILSQSNYQGCALRNWALVDWFPIFTHLVGPQQFQDNFADANSELLKKIQVSFDTWQAMVAGDLTASQIIRDAVSAADAKAGFAFGGLRKKEVSGPAYSLSMELDESRGGIYKYIPRETREDGFSRPTPPSWEQYAEEKSEGRDVHNGYPLPWHAIRATEQRDTGREYAKKGADGISEMGFYGGFQGGAEGVPGMKVSFGVPGALFHSPHYKLCASLWESCQNIWEMHMTRGHEDSELRCHLEEAFPNICSKRKRGAGETLFCFAGKNRIDRQQFPLVGTGPVDSGFSRLSICARFNNRECKGKTALYGTYLRGTSECHVRKCDKGLHVCACQGCHSAFKAQSDACLDIAHPFNYQSCGFAA